MAHKRMFSKDITTSDSFRDMPESTQNLYFHLGMEADDDGFLGNYKTLMRGIGSAEDNLKILIAKRFVIIFPSKIIVVKHWLMNNTIRKDRYSETKYLDEKQALIVKGNGSYTERLVSGKPNGNQVATQKRIEEDRIEEDRIEESEHSSQKVKSGKHSSLGADVIKAFETVDAKNKTYYGNKTQRASADFLVSEYGFKKVGEVIGILSKTNKIPFFPKINSPYDLKEKWQKLSDAIDTEKARIKANKPDVII